EIEAIVVHVSHHNMPRADETSNGGRHDADWPGACDEYVLAHHAEGEGGVSRIAEWIENRCHIVADGVSQLECVDGRDRQVLSERAGTIDADTYRVAAQMPSPRTAVTAIAASDMALSRHPIADGETANFGAHFD